MLRFVDNLIFCHKTGAFQIPRVRTLLGGFTPASPSPRVARSRHPPKATNSSNNASPLPAGGRGENTKPCNHTLVLPTANQRAKSFVPSYNSGLAGRRAGAKAHLEKRIAPLPCSRCSRRRI